VLATFGFRLYVSNFASYSKTYGFVGGIIVMLLWLYLTALTILFGGEVAATLEQRERDDWEVGRAPGRRAPAAAAEGG
jgi:membrane protein